MKPSNKNMDNKQCRKKEATSLNGKIVSIVINKECLYCARLVYHLKACVLWSRTTMDGVVSQCSYINEEIRARFSIMTVDNCRKPGMICPILLLLCSIAS